MRKQVTVLYRIFYYQNNNFKDTQQINGSYELDVPLLDFLSHKIPFSQLSTLKVYAH